MTIQKPPLTICTHVLLPQDPAQIDNSYPGDTFQCQRIGTPLSVQCVHTVFQQSLKSSKPEKTTPPLTPPARQDTVIGLSERTLDAEREKQNERNN